MCACVCWGLGVVGSSQLQLLLSPRCVNLHGGDTWLFTQCSVAAKTGAKQSSLMCHFKRARGGGGHAAASHTGANLFYCEWDGRDSFTVVHSVR